MASPERQRSKNVYEPPGDNQKATRRDDRRVPLESRLGAALLVLACAWGVLDSAVLSLMRGAEVLLIGATLAMLNLTFCWAGFHLYRGDWEDPLGWGLAAALLGAIGAAPSWLSAGYMFTAIRLSLVCIAGLTLALGRNRYRAARKTPAANGDKSG